MNGDTPNATLELKLRCAIEAALEGRGAFAGGALPATYDLHPEEAAYVAGAVEARRREFAAGRAHARDALASLGHYAGAIPMLSSRAPAWPRGFTGSISHCRTHVGAVVARQDALHALGFDLELADPLPQDLWLQVAKPAELAVTGWPAGITAKLVFCINEALFKAYHPQTGVFLGFDDACVRLCPGSGRFSVQISPSRPPLTASPALAGRVGIVGGLAFALLAVTPD